MPRFTYFLKTFLAHKASNILTNTALECVLSRASAHLYSRASVNIKIIKKINQGIEVCKEVRMSLQGLKNLFGELRGKAGSLAIAGVASAAMLAANPVASEEIPRYLDPSKAESAEELRATYENIADIKAAKIRRDVRRRSYEHPQDIGVFLLRGDGDKNKYSDDLIKETLTRKVLKHFATLTLPVPNIHIESASGANKGGTGILYYVGGEQVTYDVNGDGVNPAGENSFALGDSVSAPVLKTLSNAYKIENSH